jgi:hypothetical protein
LTSISSARDTSACEGNERISLILKISSKETLIALFKLSMLKSGRTFFNPVNFSPVSDDLSLNTFAISSSSRVKGIEPC